LFERSSSFSLDAIDFMRLLICIIVTEWSSEVTENVWVQLL
jgi:hypothetical protein